MINALSAHTRAIKSQEEGFEVTFVSHFSVFLLTSTNDIGLTFLSLLKNITYIVH